MEVLIEKKMIDIKTEPVELVVDHHHHHSKSSSRRRSTSPPTELEPCEEFPILYGLLTAPKSFKPKNSEELQLLPMSLSPPPQEEDDEVEENEEVTLKRRNEVIEGQEGGGVVVTSRVQLVQCRRPSRQRRRRRSHSSECTAAAEEEFQDNFSVSLMEEADSQNLDFCSSLSRSSSSRSRSSSFTSRSTRTADSCSNSNMSGSGVAAENETSTSPTFRNYLSGNNENIDLNSHNNENDMAEDNEEELHLHRASSPGGASCSSAGSEDSSVDDNIPTSTTSGFKRKATRLETAIGNIVRRRGKVQKRSNNNDSNNRGSSTVPISMAPSSPTVSTTVVDPPPPPRQTAIPPPPQRGRSEILERILRSNTTNTVNPASSHNQNQHSAHFPASRQDANNNNDREGQEPYAKLRDLLTMSEDQLVKRRRIEYGLSENKIQHQQAGRQEQEQQPTRRRGFSPPRSNILASLLQKGRDTSAPYHHPQHGILRSPPALMSINKLSDSSANNNTDDDRPYKCHLCDLRFKKLPLLNRHVKTHSHIKRYVCRFCSHAFKRSDNLLAHMRTSCKGIKEADTNFAQAPSPQVSRSNSNNRAGQIIPQLLSSPPTAGGPVSPLVSRSQLEEALLNLRAESAEKRYNNSPSPLVSTTTGSPPPPPTQRASRQIQPGADFQSRHSKLLEILSGSPVIAHHHSHNRFLDGGGEEDEDEETEEVEEAEVMPLPLSLKVDRRSSQNQSTVSSSSSPSPHQSQFRRSHHHRQQLERVLYSRNMNELPVEEVEVEDDNEEVELAIDPYRRGYDLYDEAPEEEENDIEQPLNLGRPCVPAPPPPVAAQSARSRDHPEIVSILSRQPKNVNVMMGNDLRKLVGLDTL